MPARAALRIGALEYRDTVTGQVRYRYHNRQPAPVEVWLALPPELPVQRLLHLDLSPAPVQRGPRTRWTG